MHDDAWWQAVRMHDTKDMYEQYLLYFPQGRHAAEARREIRQKSWEASRQAAVIQPQSRPSQDATMHAAVVKSETRKATAALVEAPRRAGMQDAQVDAEMSALREMKCLPLPRTYPQPDSRPTSPPTLRVYNSTHVELRVICDGPEGEVFHVGPQSYKETALVNGTYSLAARSVSSNVCFSGKIVVEGANLSLNLSVPESKSVGNKKKSTGAGVAKKAEKEKKGNEGKTKLKRRGRTRGSGDA